MNCIYRRFFISLTLFLSLMISTNVHATSMQVKEFEWRPSVVLVGQATSFHWNIENATSCFGNNKSRSPSGNNGRHAYSTAQFKLTSWTCTDSQGRTISLSANLTVEERPSTPSNPYATVENNNINVSWGSVSGAAIYSVYYKSDSNNWTLLANTRQANLSTNLFEPGSYSFKIRACTANSNCSGFSSVTSAAISPPSMVVRQFEWQPSKVEVGELTSFHWNVENAVSCFGNNKQRAGSGNNGKHFYTEPELKRTQWYCNDKYGNRLPENPNEFLTASLEVKPKPMHLKEFEWQPSVIEEGKKSVFRWNVENASACFGEHKTHQSFGSDERQFNEEQIVTTKWYCEDKYGNRFPASEGEFLTTKLQVVQSNKANLPACFDVPENTAPNQPIKISWCNTAKQDVKKFEVYGELKGLLFEGSPTNIVKNTFGQFEINRPTLSEGREYCYKVIAHFNDGSMGQFTETKCTQVGAKLFEEPTNFSITAQNSSYVFEWSNVVGAHHYMLEQRVTTQPATWQAFNCNNRPLHKTQCQTNLQTTDFLSELNNTAIFRVAACTSENKCGDYRRANVQLVTEKEKKIIYIHTDLLGSPVAETQKGGMVQ